MIDCVDIFIISCGFGNPLKILHFIIVFKYATSPLNGTEKVRRLLTDYRNGLFVNMRCFGYRRGNLSDMSRTHVYSLIIDFNWIDVKPFFIFLSFYSSFWILLFFNQICHAWSSRRIASWSLWASGLLESECHFPPSLYLSLNLFWLSPDFFTPSQKCLKNVYRNGIVTRSHWQDWDTCNVQ